METKESKLSLIKTVCTSRNAVRTAIIALVAFMAWFQFGGVEKNMLALMQRDTISLVHSARTFLASSLGDEKLSTGAAEENAMIDQIGATWQFQKAQKGESVWGVYAESVQGNTEIGFRTQVINGLKNITVLQNGIADENVGARSLTAGKEYSFLNAEAVARYAGKVKEANDALHAGTHVNDLRSDLQLAYRIANAPSYQFFAFVTAG